MTQLSWNYQNSLAGTELMLNLAPIDRLHKQERGHKYIDIVSI